MDREKKKLDGKSFDIIEDNIKKLQELFPEIVTEGKVDIDKLALLFDKARNEDTEGKLDGEERYEFTWKGKKEAMRIAQKQSTGTLRPCREESVNFDDTENLYIEGDNLEVLRALQSSYRGKVKMIYIDPPYNTGNDFVYKDDFKDNIANYKEKMNEAYKTNTSSDGRYHTNWLNMMYPRLKLARNLLTDDGVIFISIDDKEVNNLRKICDEIFGEDNFVNNISVKMSEVSGNKMAHATKKLPKVKEYLLVYKKNEINIKKIKIRKREWDKEYNIFLENFTLEDKNMITKISEKEKRDENDILTTDKILSKIQTKPLSLKVSELGISKENELDWKLKNSYRICRTASSISVKKLADEKRKINSNKFFSVLSNKEKLLYIVKADYSEESNSPRVQVLFADDNLSVGLSDMWIDINTTGLEFEGNVDYKNGKKPLKLIDRAIELIVDKDDLIMDFFAGSSTTAESVIRNNNRRMFNNKFIMVQIPEDLDINLKESDSNNKKSIEETIKFLDYIDKPRFITEIGKERIRRAGKKILEENKGKEGIEDLDIGFKVFKLDSTNLKAWDENLQSDKDMVEQLEDLQNPIKEGRTTEDLVYEIMLKYGVDLTMPIEELEILGSKVYSVGCGYLMICLEDNISLDLIEAIGNEKPNRVVLADKGLTTSDLINGEKILTELGVQDIRTI